MKLRVSHPWASAIRTIAPTWGVVPVAELKTFGTPYRAPFVLLPTALKEDHGRVVIRLQHCYDSVRVGPRRIECQNR